MHLPLRALAIVLLSLFLSAAASAQGDQRKLQENFSGEGSEFFRALLRIRGISPVKDVDLNKLHHFNDVIVVVIGDPKTMVMRQRSSAQHHQIFITRTPEQIMNAATQGGGAVMVATDTAFSFLPGVKERIAGSDLFCTDRKSIWGEIYQDCPLVKPFPPPIHNLDLQAEVRKLFNGDGDEMKPLERVAAGTPSYITIDKKQHVLEPLARFPGQTFIRSTGQPLPDAACFAAGAEFQGAGGNYRYLAFASSKVFNNRLLFEAVANKPEDRTDNLELSMRVIDYLQGSTQFNNPQFNNTRQRTKCVFIEQGQLIDHFDDLARATFKQQIPLPQTDIGRREQRLVELADKLLVDAENNDVLNKALNGIAPLKYIVLVLLIASSILVCLFLARKAIMARKPGDTPPAPTIAGATSEPPGVFERRQKELLRRDNIYEPVRDLIREFFGSVGIHGEPGPKVPRINISDVVRKPDSLRLAIKDLWRLAYGEPQVFTIGQWRDLQPYFERVKVAHGEGKWAFKFEGVSLA